MTHIGSMFGIQEFHRLGKYNCNKTRSIIVNVNDSFTLDDVLHKAKVLKSFPGDMIYINKFLSGDELLCLKAALSERNRLIAENKHQKSEIKVRGGKLFVSNKYVPPENYHLNGSTDINNGNCGLARKDLTQSDS